MAEAIGRRPDGHRGLLGALIHDPAPVRLADLTTDPRYAGFPSGHPRMRTFLGVPIRVQGDVFGNLYLAEKQDGAEFSDYDLHMVRVLATEAGIAIGNARLYEAARQREHWIDGSVAVTTALLSGGDADEALSVVAEQARRLADSAAGIVLLPAEEGGLEIVAVSSDDPASSLGVIIPPRSAVVAKLLAGEAVFIDDSATDRRMITRLAERFGPSMMLPLHSGGRVLGALATPRARGARPFTETERTLATQFASQAALALMIRHPVTLAKEPSPWTTSRAVGSPSASAPVAAASTPPHWARRRGARANAPTGSRSSFRSWTGCSPKAR
ncbi:GAF sensor signal transduction histidine kinase OS=Streptomyces sp. ACT-1 OX=1609288 GN=SACT1_3941 PE=4 SV=1 [Streptomyces griseus subsp. griseus]